MEIPFIVEPYGTRHRFPVAAREIGVPCKYLDKLMGSGEKLCIRDLQGELVTVDIRRGFRVIRGGKRVVYSSHLPYLALGYREERDITGEETEEYRVQVFRRVNREVDAEAAVNIENEVCGDLLTGILEKAVRDIKWLEKNKSNGKPHAIEKRTRISKLSCPYQFFESSRFDDICYMLGITPEIVRDRVRQIYE